MIKECSNINDIPWKKWWEEMMENSSWSKKSVKVWDKRAPYFYQNSKKKQSNKQGDGSSFLFFNKQGDGSLFVNTLLVL